MLKAGNGFFAMWAGIAPDVAAAFELMHARDHLAEHLAYLGEGGILWARRYGEGQGILPPNFAFYGMRDLDRLTGPGSAERKVFETEFFKAIRPHYRDRIAHHCRVLGSAGAGTGSAVATFLLDLRAEDGAPAQIADRLTCLPSVTAAHIGAVDWGVPIRAGGVPPPCPPGDERLGIAVVEGFSRWRMAGEFASITEILGQAGTIRSAGHYGFSYALDYAEVPGLRHHRRDHEVDPQQP
ncbi:hypothetical protein FHT98_1721 [Bosea sp. AK1]|uniref:hypothetical protein n=1 Tax=Bosea sp. AK1 TaxID=2587160 RepID=UPI0011508E00|nr:hypothetical protein [Bosea sp. AK1]TQI73983.1 hypothetical protein FHT98_1721 [Bosea sp. AK1]